MLSCQLSQLEFEFVKLVEQAIEFYISCNQSLVSLAFQSSMINTFYNSEFL